MRPTKRLARLAVERHPPSESRVNQLLQTLNKHLQAMEKHENRAVFEKMRGKIRSCDCAFFKLTYFPKKEKNKLLWLKCLLNVIIKHQLSFFGGVVRLPPYKNERHQLVTFTDGSDMYIHFKVLYIAVMLGIVQKEE